MPDPRPMTVALLRDLLEGMNPKQFVYVSVQGKLVPLTTVTALRGNPNTILSDGAPIVQAPAP